MVESAQARLSLWRLARPFLAVLGIFCLLGQGTLIASEKTDFNDACKLFENKFWPQAESRFAAFAGTYTNSTQLLPAAILYQARARLEQFNYEGAIDLLQAKLPAAGNLAEQYHYYISESLYLGGKYQAAAESCASFIKAFPQSSLRLAASVREAQTCAKLEDWSRVADLLQRADGTFRLTSRDQPKNDWTVIGSILLGQALFFQHHYAEGAQVVRDISPDGLSRELDWQRQYWLCRLQLAGDHAGEALQGCTNRLLGLAAGQSHDMAESFSLEGEILEKLDRLPEAVDVYTNNLAENRPADLQRQALFKTVELMLKEKQAASAMARLESFIEQRPADSVLDIARLTLGELALKSFYAAPDLGTNSAPVAAADYLREAFTNFDRLIQEIPGSPLLGKAYLDRGWCYWAQTNSHGVRTNLPLAEIDFAEAVSRLQASPEAQAVARFKLADSQYSQGELAALTNGYRYSQGEFAAATTNYSLVLRQKLPEAHDNLFEKALYQILRASIALDDPDSASVAVLQIVEWYPYSLFSDDCMLLYGDYQTRKDKCVEARKIFTDLITKFPNSTNLAEVQFAIARTFVQEGDWGSAASNYDRWVTRYPQHRLLPQAEFSRALAHDNEGNETNALMLLTNFVVRFPSNELAPLAQNWVADYYFNHEDYVRAEINYLLLTQRFPAATNLTYQAQLMAGRSAFARQGPKDIEQAGKYFSALISDTNAPARLVIQSYFALGDTIFQQLHDNPDSTNKFSIFSDVISAFSKITNGTPTNTLAPLAMGRIGACYFEWGQRFDTNVFTNAVQAYQAVLAYPQVSYSARSQAEVQLGLIAQSQGQTNQALDHYLKVLYAGDPERMDPDPVWVKEAGVKAAEICSRLKLWEQEISVYERVMKAIPTLRPVMEKRIAAAIAQREAATK